MKQEEILRKIISENKDTAYGKEYGFAFVRNEEDYKTRVPVSEYADYTEWIDRMTEGEENVLTVYPIVSMLKTSGGTGFRKKIPLTANALEHYSDKIYRNVIGDTGKGRCLFLSIFNTDLHKKMQKENILSIVYYRYLYEKGSLDPEISVGGERLLYATDIQDVLYVKVWSAFYEKKIMTFHSIFLYDVLLFFYYIETHGQEILKSMKEKKIPDDIQISKEVREYLLTRLMPDKERLQELEKHLSQGMDGLGKRLWPELNMISGIGGNFFDAREKVLRNYTGKVSFHYFAYVASECMMGIADQMESAEYRLFSDNGFYEFDPVDQSGEVVDCENVQIGKKYELIVTNWSGLYRYRIGDIVTVTGFKNGMPVIRVCCRKNQAINLAGEKTSCEMLDCALNLFSIHNGLSLYDYSVWEDSGVLPGRYLFLMECGKALTVKQVKQYQNQLDQILRKVNPEYDEIRDLHQLSAPRLVPLKTGAHNRVQTGDGKMRHSKPMSVHREGEPFNYEKEQWIKE